MVNATENFRKEFIQCQNTMEDWFSLKREEKGKSLSQLLEMWDVCLVMQIIFESHAKEQYIFAQYLKDCKALKKQYTESHRIAVYYYRYGSGGVERVISYLLPLYVQAGYGVTLITDEEPDTRDYPLPPNVKRYLISKQKDVLSGRKDYSQRSSELLGILEKENIDTLCYHAASNPLLFYDLVAVKSIGVKFVITKHEMFSQYMAVGKDVITDEMYTYSLADTLTVLSREEEAFWKVLGVKSFMVPNPIGESYSENYLYDNECTNIVWVGRLDRNQKQYQDIVPIMQEVVKKLPDCCLYIYGGADNYKDQYLLEKQIKESGLGGHIKYQGYCSSVMEIYKNAGVLLITSAYEASPMVILESKQLGIPLVTYSMPYLELLKEKKGFIEVEQGDIPAAAEALIKILSDKEMKNKLSGEAKQSVSAYSNAMVMEKWKQVFLADCGTLPSVPQEGLEDLYPTILKTMIFHQSLGCEKYNTLRKNYKRLRIENKLYQIEKIVKTGGRKIALYPYGMLGKEIRGWIEEKNMSISLIVDNKLANKENDILAVEDLEKIDINAFLFIICSDNASIYDEIRECLYRVVPQANIFDWFPRDEESV